ncbi:AT hook motif-containing protein [Striga asiatica]|uniref:AT hook motif-containing protein n=1 Tax=Striga asiatica TaxID=4170 RepID=A0A5A7RGT6_STRAF|nr:AT hook motif-containing protein [Striga asiatica]
MKGRGAERNNLDGDIVRGLQALLDLHNVLVKSFRMAREKVNQHEGCDYGEWKAEDTKTGTTSNPQSRSSDRNPDPPTDTNKEQDSPSDKGSDSLRLLTDIAENHVLWTLKGQSREHGKELELKKADSREIAQKTLKPRIKEPKEAE